MASRTKKRVGAKAERLFAKWLEGNGAMPGAYMRAMRVGSGKHTVRHDFLGCLDFVIPGFRIVHGVGGREPGLEADPDVQLGVQVTTSNGISLRKRKIEARDWGDYWQIVIVTHEVEPKNRWGVHQLSTPSVGGFAWSQYSWAKFSVEFVLKETESRRLG